jgi:hypothetical protein
MRPGDGRDDGVAARLARSLIRLAAKYSGLRNRHDACVFCRRDA